MVLFINLTGYKGWYIMLNIIYLLSFKVQCTFLEFSNIFGNDFLATSLQ